MMRISIIIGRLFLFRLALLKKRVLIVMEGVRLLWSSRTTRLLGICGGNQPTFNRAFRFIKIPYIIRL